MVCDATPVASSWRHMKKIHMLSFYGGHSSWPIIKNKTILHRRCKKSVKALEMLD